MVVCVCNDCVAMCFGVPSVGELCGRDFVCWYSAAKLHCTIKVRNQKALRYHSVVEKRCSVYRRREDVGASQFVCSSKRSGSCRIRAILRDCGCWTILLLFNNKNSYASDSLIMCAQLRHSCNALVLCNAASGNRCFPP
jgi:hypothetical protein